MYARLHRRAARERVIPAIRELDGLIGGIHLWHPQAQAVAVGVTGVTGVTGPAGSEKGADGCPS